MSWRPPPPAQRQGLSALIADANGTTGVQTADSDVLGVQPGALEELDLADG